MKRKSLRGQSVRIESVRRERERGGGECERRDRKEYKEEFVRVESV